MPGLKFMDGNGIRARTAQQAREIFEQRSPQYSYLYATPRNLIDRERFKWPEPSWVPD